MKLGGMLKELQQIQENLQTTLEELGEIQVEGEAGGGLVKATISGDNNLLSLKIDQSVVDPEDIETLEDLVVAAVRSASEKAATLKREKIQAATAGLPLPPGLIGLW